MRKEGDWMEWVMQLSMEGGLQWSNVRFSQNIIRNDSWT